jgi:hypothetical protein
LPRFLSDKQYGTQLGLLVVTRGLKIICKMSQKMFVAGTDGLLKILAPFFSLFSADTSRRALLEVVNAFN